MQKITKRKHAGDIIESRTLESIQGDPVPIPHPSRLIHLQFRRFAGCPMCNLHIQSFIRRYEEFVKRKIQTVAIFHSSREDMRKRHAEAPFPLIADPEKTLYKEFGVESSVMAVLNPRAWSAAVKGLVRHGVMLPALGESPLGLPADFLIDTDGRIVAAKYGEHAYDHWEVDDVLQLAQKAAD